MAVPKWHRSKSRQGKTRMHIFLKKPSFSSCLKCGKKVLPHRMCENCGFYHGRQVVDVLLKLNKKERKRKEKEMATQEKEQGDKAKEISMEGMSKK